MTSPHPDRCHGAEPMSDIKERLLSDAAARIEALEAENARLQAERCITLHDAAEYWREAIGGRSYTPSVLGKHVASHPTTVARAMRIAGQRAPEVADVIAALVWKMTLAENRAAWIAEIADEQRKAAEADRDRLAGLVKELVEGAQVARDELAGIAEFSRFENIPLRPQEHAHIAKVIAASDALITRAKGASNG